MSHEHEPSLPSTSRKSRCTRQNKTATGTTPARGPGICLETRTAEGTFGWLRGLATIRTYPQFPSLLSCTQIIGSEKSSFNFVRRRFLGQINVSTCAACFISVFLGRKEIFVAQFKNSRPFGYPVVARIEMTC